MVIFGVKSPLVVELEETLRRLGLPISAAVRFDETSRAADVSRIVPIAELDPELNSEPFLPCAFAARRRREISQVAKDLGFGLTPAVIDPTAVVASTSNLSAGVFVNAGAVIGAVAMIREGAFINRAASVGHHCIIGTYCSIGPGAVLASNVTLEDDVVIGAGAVLLPDIHIGEGAVIAAGALVAKDVPSGALVRSEKAKVIPDGALGLALAEGAQE